MRDSLPAFADELTKIAFDWDKAKRVGLTAAGGVAGAAAATGAIVAARPALRAHVKHMLKSIGKSRYAKEEAAKIPKVVIQNARAIAKQLRAQGIDPAKARIAIAGTGGTGKSTLARALGKEMKMGVRALDGAIGGGSDLAGRSLSKHLAKHPIPAGTIADQTHILTQVNPDKFDVIIRVHKPTKDVEKQIVGRGRGAGQVEFYNYRKLNDAISTAFHNTKGKTLTPVAGVEMKVKPRGGFQADQMLREKAKQMGVGGKKLRDRPTLVNAVGLGEAKPGLAPYIRTKRLAAGGALVAGGSAGGTYAAHKAQD